MVYFEGQEVSKEFEQGNYLMWSLFLKPLIVVW
jgi:hypothetical protein